MSGEEKRIIEIQGVKLEVDLRTATTKRIESYKLHDNIKLLINDGYKDNPNWKVYPGVIAGFIEFEKKPIIVIAYLKMEYNSAEIKFVNLSEDSKDIEIAPALAEELPIKEMDIMQKLDRDIETAKAELRDAEAKKNYFVKHFAKYFEREKVEVNS